ncbi:hypothetical protein ACFY05_32020 [Microtetraspora fusca]|uniref:Uncharacterized protein n=1 Tax=Microtetraspora fusca TaxID=1997 RepID=A0ABW6VES3_MICFU
MDVTCPCGNSTQWKNVRLEDSTASVTCAVCDTVHVTEVEW